MNGYGSLAGEVVARCRMLAAHSEESGHLSRTFLSEAMRSAQAQVREWMERAGMRVHLDDAGNLRGCYPGVPSAIQSGAKRLIIGSHLDTVPHAGAFDGALGVLMGIGLVELLDGRDFRLPIEVVGFSEEEGVRFGVPFIGSRAMIGELDEDVLAREDAQGISIRDAIRNFGLDPSRARIPTEFGAGAAYLEFHIEQGPVLDSLGLSLGVVQTIVGQSRAELHFSGTANHAGTTPMRLRRDALAGAAEWIAAVEREALAVPDLVATVGRVEVEPGAGNVVPGSVTVSLDVRHEDDTVRHVAVARLLRYALEISERRKLGVSSKILVDQPAVAMDAGLTQKLARAADVCGIPVRRMNSGAGHDAMILARRIPSAMLFLRSPGGISHHPDESVLIEDVAAALAVGRYFLEGLEAEVG